MKNICYTFPLLFKKQPVYYIVHVTNKCNAKCSHCFYWKEINNGKNMSELSLNDYENISKNIGKIIVVNLCGAEPYMREDLCEITNVFALNTKCRMITIPSNGLLTDRIVKYTDKMCKENPDTFFRFGFSIDGPEEKHDLIRGRKGAFEKVCETIKQVNSLRRRHKNFIVITNTIFSLETQHYIFDFLDWIRVNLSIEQTNITLIRGNPEKGSLLNVNPEIYTKLTNEIHNRAKINPRPIFNSLIPFCMFLKTIDTIKKTYKTKDRRCFKCYAGNKFVVIGRGGDVYPCEILDERHKLGNLKEFNYDIKKLINSYAAKKVLQWINAGHCSCTWECAIQASFFFNPMQWPHILKKATTTYFHNS